jgi:hypothetical protein
MLSDAVRSDSIRRSQQITDRNAKKMVDEFIATGKNKKPVKES